MNTFVKYIQNFFALFLLLMVVRQLIPNGRLKKYIYFFTELVFVIGILQPFFSLFGDDADLLDQIRYETFTENLSEASRDVSRMEFLQNDYYRKEYEDAAALDVLSTADGYLDPFGLAGKRASVELTENYEVKKSCLRLGKKRRMTRRGCLWNREKHRAARLCLTN